MYVWVWYACVYTHAYVYVVCVYIFMYVCVYSCMYTSEYLQRGTFKKVTRAQKNIFVTHSQYNSYSTRTWYNSSVAYFSGFNNQLSVGYQRNW